MPDADRPDPDRPLPSPTPDDEQPEDQPADALPFVDDDPALLPDPDAPDDADALDVPDVEGVVLRSTGSWYEVRLGRLRRARPRDGEGARARALPAAPAPNLRDQPHRGRRPRAAAHGRRRDRAHHRNRPAREPAQPPRLGPPRAPGARHRGQPRPRVVHPERVSAQVQPWLRGPRAGDGRVLRRPGRPRHQQGRPDGRPAASAGGAGLLERALRRPRLPRPLHERRNRRRHRRRWRANCRAG